jgi:hypothetical protein
MRQTRPATTSNLQCTVTAGTGEDPPPAIASTDSDIEADRIVADRAVRRSATPATANADNRQTLAILKRGD